MQVVKKTKQVTRLFANTIKGKMITASQVLYINDICLILRIEYMLQNTFLTKKECEAIQQPYMMIAKNKIGLARTFLNFVISHSGILSM